MCAVVSSSQPISQITSSKKRKYDSRIESDLLRAKAIVMNLLQNVRKEKAIEDSKESKAKVECYYTGQSDSNQTGFEILTTQNILGVWASSEKEASAIFVALRMMADENPFPVLAHHDGEYGDDINHTPSEEVTKTPNRLFCSRAPAESGIALSRLLNVDNADHPGIMFDLDSVEKKLTDFI